MNKSPIDKILDENNAENIIMYNENNQPVEFEQIAVVPLDGAIYVILKPVGDMEGVAEDEALVFAITEHEDEDVLEIVDKDEVIDAVFGEYYRMLAEAGIIE